MHNQWYLVSIFFVFFSFACLAHSVEEPVQADVVKVGEKSNISPDVTAKKSKKSKDVFDKNHDGKIDATDWKKMKESEKRAYARKLIIALGQDPDSSLGGLGTREAQYLKSLKMQFEEE